MALPGRRGRITRSRDTVARVFVLLLTYTRPLDQEEIEALAATDPFVTGGVATCEVVAFRASQVADELRPLLDRSR